MLCLTFFLIIQKKIDNTSFLAIIKKELFTHSFNRLTQYIVKDTSDTELTNYSYVYNHLGNRILKRNNITL